MTKKKKIIILSTLVAVAVILTVAATVGSKLYQKDLIDFAVHDTLPDGGGKKARVILLAGQSNAAGCSSDTYLRQNTTAEQYAVYKNGFDNVYINYYVTGTNESREFVKCKTLQGEAGGYFGPELGLAERLAACYPDETFFIIKCTWSGTNLFEQWLSPSADGKTGILYRNFIRFVGMNLKYLASKNYDVSVEGMCWMQGESDSFSTEAAENYGENLTDFIGDIRKKFARYAAEDGIAFADAYIADNPAYWVYCATVNAEKAEVAAASPLNVVVDTVGEGLTCAHEPEGAPDMAHYDAMSEIKLGHLFAEALAPFLD